MSDVALYQQRDNVVQLHLQGISEQKIAKALGITWKQVKEHLAEFKAVARSDEQLQNRGREVVHEFDSQQNTIIEKMWEVHAEAEQVGDHKVMVTALTNLASIQAKRVDVLQRAGLIAENSLTDELAETQNKFDILVQVFKEIKDEHPEVAEKIARALRKVTGQTQDVPPGA